MVKRTNSVHFIMGRLSGPFPSSFSLLPAISPYLRRQIGRLKADQQYASAREAILDRVKNSNWRAALYGTGTPDPEILTTLACATVVSAQPPRKDWMRAIEGESGVSWKALQNFPERIERMAEKIEALNRNTLLAPANQVDAQAANAEIARQSLRNLPGMMRVWAKALRERMKVMPRLDAAVFGKWTPIDYLQLFVKEATGKPCDRLLVDLLNAAAIALGKDPKFDALALAQARYRRKRTMSGI